MQVPAGAPRASVGAVRHPHTGHAGAGQVWGHHGRSSVAGAYLRMCSLVQLLLASVLERGAYVRMCLRVCACVLV